MERFSFDDPLSMTSASRSTRYRTKKRREISYEQYEGAATGGSDHGLLSPPGSAAADETFNTEFSLSEGLSAELETSPYKVSQSSLGENVTELDDYDLPVNEPEHDFDQRFIESLCIDGDSDYDSESDVCTSACEDDLHGGSNTVPPDSGIFDGSPLSVSASGLLIMQFKQRHQLTKEGLGDLIRLIRLHLPTPNQCPPSLYLFNKQFQEAKLSIILHYFCAMCLQELADNTISCCPNDRCARDLTLDGSVSSFIEVPIEQQLKAIIGRKW